MARWWQGVTLSVAWLGSAVLAQAQVPADNGAAPGAVTTALAAGEGDKASAAPAPTPAPSAGPPVPFIALPPQAGAYTTSGKVGPENAFTVDPLPKIPPECFHFGADYLLWFLPRQPIPALVNIGSPNDRVPGAVGQPGTRNGFDAVNEGTFQFSGCRLMLGIDLDCAKCLSLQSSYFILEQRSAFQAIQSSGVPGSLTLSRPFFNVNANREDADPISYPGVMSGRALIDLPQRFQGGDFLVRYNYQSSGSLMTRTALLVGFRYLRLSEGLSLAEQVVDLPGLGAGGNVARLIEDFRTMNNFYGGQVGAECEWRLDKLIVTGIGKLGVGNTAQTVRINGGTQIFEPNGTITTARNRALLVQPSNAGTFTRDSACVVPECEFNVGYQCNEHVRLSCGYSLIFWPAVLRPGEQIDRSINIQALQPFDQIGPARPAFIPQENRQFWAQGLSLSMLLSF